MALNGAITSTGCTSPRHSASGSQMTLMTRLKQNTNSTNQYGASLTAECKR